MSKYEENLKAVTDTMCLECEGEGDVPCKCGQSFCHRHPCNACDETGIKVDPFKVFWEKEGKALNRGMLNICSVSSEYAAVMLASKATFNAGRDSQK